MLIFRKQDKKISISFFEKKIINVKKICKKIILDKNLCCHMFIHLVIIQIKHNEKKYKRCLKPTF